VTTSPSSWLARLGLDRPELRAWALYDWANSAMVTVIITAVFPPFFASVSAHGLTSAQGSTIFSTTTFVSMLATFLASPLLGAVADARPLKKPFLGFFILMGVGAVGAMFFLRHGDWLFASVLFGLANFAANCSFVFYDALLPHIAREDEMDRVSSAGYALGYVGGAFLLALNLAWILKPQLFGLPSGPDLSPAQKTLPARLAFLSVAIWWGVFSIPLFRRVPEPPLGRRRRPISSGPGTDNPSPPEREPPPADDERTLALGRIVLDLWHTLKELGKLPDAALMLVAFLLYNDGIGTIIRMAALYGTEIGIAESDLIAAILLTQVIGIPCAFAFGSLASRYGAKRLIFVGLLAYLGISIVGYGMSKTWHFFVLAVLVGMVQGGTQALSRSLFASLIPKQKSAEFFGFFAVAEKFAGIFGPGLFAISASLTGSNRAAILSVILFFILGGAVLWQVDVARGQAAARAAEAA
jgi:UMF1 family MFS transporter